MDKDNNKLKDYFDQFLEDESAPAFVWDDIDQKLDLEEAGLLEDSFEEFYADEAPDAMLAENIHDHLEQQDSDGLKANFDSFYADEEADPPLSVWSNVQDQLDLDQTWVKMEPGLDRAQKWHLWKIRLKRITAAAMLLLLLRTCVGDGHFSSFINTNNTQRTEPIALKTKPSSQKKQAHSQENKPPVLTENSNNAAKDPNKAISTKTNQPLASKNSVSTNKPSNKKAKHTIVSNQNNSDPTKPSKKLNALETPQVVAPISPALSPSNNNDDHQTSSDNNHIAFAGRSNTEQPNEVSKVSKSTNLTHTTKTGNQQVGNTITISTPNTDSPLLTPSENATKSLSTLDLTTLFANALAVDSFEFPLAETLPFELEKKRNNPLLKFPKFELGLIGKIGTSFLLNNRTSESLRYNSLNDTKLHASGSVGFIGSLRFDAKNALVFQIAPYTPIRQSYTAFSSSGTFYEQDIKLTYLDVALGYERTLLAVKKHNGQPLASIFARADVGISYLSIEEISQNDALVTESAFNKLNYSLTLALGNKQHIKRFTIDYGIFGTVGLNDINNYTFLGNQSTNLIHLGGFLGLRYQL